MPLSTAKDDGSADATEPACDTTPQVLSTDLTAEPVEREKDQASHGGELIPGTPEFDAEARRIAMEADAGNPPPAGLVPGKPYTPTEAQRVHVPRGLSWKQERKFLQRDLDAALDYEPTWD
jgi:hypothetical protein